MKTNQSLNANKCWWLSQITPLNSPLSGILWPINWFSDAWELVGIGLCLRLSSRILGCWFDFWLFDLTAGGERIQLDVRVDHSVQPALWHIQQHRQDRQRAPQPGKHQKIITQFFLFVCLFPFSLLKDKEKENKKNKHKKLKKKIDFIDPRIVLAACPFTFPCRKLILEQSTAILLSVCLSVCLSFSPKINQWMIQCDKSNLKKERNKKKSNQNQRNNFQTIKRKKYEWIRN